MNERIKKLADKIWSLDIEPNPHFQLCLQSFAESIVQECVDTVLDSSVESATRPQIANELKQHFGVE